MASEDSRDDDDLELEVDNGDDSVTTSSTSREGLPEASDPQFLPMLCGRIAVIENMLAAAGFDKRTFQSGDSVAYIHRIRRVLEKGEVSSAFTKPLVTPLPASKSLELPDGFTPMKLRDGDKLREALPGWMVDAKGTPYFHPLNDYWKNLISYYGASALVKSFPGTPLEDIPNSAVVEAWLNGGANQLVYKLLDTDTIPFLRRRVSKAAKDKRGRVFTAEELLSNQPFIWSTFYLQAASDCGFFDTNRYTESELLIVVNKVLQQAVATNCMKQRRQEGKSTSQVKSRKRRALDEEDGENEEDDSAFVIQLPPSKKRRKTSVRVSAVGTSKVTVPKVPLLPSKRGGKTAMAKAQPPPPLPPPPLPPPPPSPRRKSGRASKAQPRTPLPPSPRRKSGRASKAQPRTPPPPLTQKRRLGATKVKKGVTESRQPLKAVVQKKGSQSDHPRRKKTSGGRKRPASADAVTAFIREQEDKFMPRDDDDDDDESDDGDDSTSADGDVQRPPPPNPLDRHFDAIAAAYSGTAAIECAGDDNNNNDDDDLTLPTDLAPLDVVSLESAWKTKFVEWATYVTVTDPQEVQKAKFENYGIEYEPYLQLISMVTENCGGRSVAVPCPFSKNENGEVVLDGARFKEQDVVPQPLVSPTSP